MTCATTTRLLATLVLGGLTLSACHPVRRHGSIFHVSHPAYTRIVTRLTCPNWEEGLARVDMAADGSGLAVEMRPGSMPMPVAARTTRADSVDPNDPATWRNASRNGPCPCGSGKKYKHCHGMLS